MISRVWNGLKLLAVGVDIVIPTTSEEPPAVFLKEFYQISAFHHSPPYMLYYTHYMRIRQEGIIKSKTFFGGDLLMLPSGYKRLEYIQSSGTQYIDTGYKADQNRRVVMNVQPLVQIKNAWLFEERNTSTQARSGIFFYYSSTKLWTSDWPSGRQNFSEIAETDRLLIDANKTICTVNEHSLTHTEKTFQSDYTLTLLACNTGGTISRVCKCQALFLPNL